jgi:hypothetical protein
MKTFSWALGILMVLVPAAVFAQQASEIELTRSVIQTKKKIIVATNMPLTEQESEAFWPVYNDYQQALRKVNDRSVKLIEGYARDYLTLTDEKAKEMLNEFLDIESEKVKLKKSYVKKFRKVLPDKKVTRYFQVENKLEAIINFELADTIPLVR